MATTTHTKDELIRDVRIILDQNENNDPLSGTFGDPDQLQTDDIIEKCLQYAIDRVLEIAPLDLIAEYATAERKVLNSRIHSMNCKYGKYVNLDFDYSRIVSVFCDDWEQPVTEILNFTDPLYKQMKSKFAGIRGNANRPYAFLGIDPANQSGMNVLEVYDTNATGTESPKAYITYIPKVAVSDSMSIPNMIYQSIVYTAASLYYVTLGNKQMADMMAAEAAESMKLRKVEES